MTTREDRRQQRLQHRTAGQDINNLTGLRCTPYFRVSYADKDESTASGKVEKSVRDQETYYRDFEQRRGVTTTTYDLRDIGLSASEFASKDRPEYQRLLAIVAAHETDVIWFWDIDRQARNGPEYDTLISLCQVYGIRWVEMDDAKDPNNPDHLIMLDFKNMMAKNFSRKLAKNVFRGLRENALTDGKPHAHPPFGYRRVPNPTTGKFGQQLIDDEPIVLDDGTILEPVELNDGTTLDLTPASLVRWMFKSFASGTGTNMDPDPEEDDKPFSLMKICRQLTEWRVPSPRALRSGYVGRPWGHGTVRAILTNPQYIGKRAYQIEDHASRIDAIVDTGKPPVWEALVGEGLFWAVQRRIGDQKRVGTRDGSVMHLLSHLARCAECDGPMSAKTVKATRSGGPDRPSYSCDNYDCHRRPAISELALDEYVERKMLRFFGDQKVYDDIARNNNDAAAAQLDAEIVALQNKLDVERTAYETSESISGASFDKKAKMLKAKITALEVRRSGAALPHQLKEIWKNGVAGAAAQWENTGLTGRRDLIKLCVAVLEVRATGRQGSTAVEPVDRVTWAWELGPDAEKGETPTWATAMIDDFMARPIEHRRLGVWYREIADGVTPWRIANTINRTAKELGLPMRALVPPAKRALVRTNEDGTVLKPVELPDGTILPTPLRASGYLPIEEVILYQRKR